MANGQVLVTGGVDSAATPLSSVERYNPAIPTVTATGSLITARGYGTATLLANGQVLVAGGFDSSENPTASAELFNPANLIWYGTDDMQEPRAAPTATLLASGEVLVAGGSADNTAELYDPLAGTWSFTGVTVVMGRSTAASTLLSDGRVLVTGGYDSNGNPAEQRRDLRPRDQHVGRRRKHVVGAGAPHRDAHWKWHRAGHRGR